MRRALVRQDADRARDDRRAVAGIRGIRRRERARRKERSLLMMTALRAYDERILDVITARRKRWLDIFMRCITHAGDWPSMVGITATLSFGFPSGLRRVGLKCLAVLTVSHLLVQLMKRTINRPRPKLRPTGLFVLEPPDRFSFPSGHAHRRAGGRDPALLRASPAGGLHRSRSRAGHRRVARLPGRALSGGRRHGLGDGDHDRADRGLEPPGLSTPSLVRHSGPEVAAERGPSAALWARTRRRSKTRADPGGLWRQRPAAVPCSRANP